jgi:transcriptional regulator with XRE-family HTH domain
MATDVCILLGKRIRQLRQKRGWRQIDLAEHSGVREVHISHVERGTREICLRNIVAIAGALEVRLSELMRCLD